MRVRSIAMAGLLAFMLFLCSCGEQEPKVEDVVDMEYTITMQVYANDGITTEEIQREGLYTGQTIDGVPNGNGSFSSQNESGDTWIYEGEFENGTFHGQGSCTWDAEGIIQEVGTYTNGLFTPTKSEFLAMAPKLLLTSFTMQENTKAFIDANENLFPCEDEEDSAELETMANESIAYKQLAKNIVPYTDTMIHLSLHATQVTEQSILGKTFTAIIAEDDGWNYFQIYYIGSVDLYEDDYFSVYGIPMDYSSYENMLGSQTSAVVIAACSIDLA